MLDRVWELLQVRETVSTVGTQGHAEAQFFLAYFSFLWYIRVKGKWISYGTICYETEFTGQKGSMSTGADGDDPQPTWSIQRLSTTDLQATITSEKSLQKCADSRGEGRSRPGEQREEEITGKLWCSCGAKVEIVKGKIRGKERKDVRMYLANFFWLLPLSPFLSLPPFRSLCLK